MLKYTTTENGALFVMMAGTTGMPGIRIDIAGEVNRRKLYVSIRR